MFPLGLVTMLFLVLFVWGCAGKGKGGDTTRVLTTARGGFVSVCPCMCMYVLFYRFESLHSDPCEN